MDDVYVGSSVGAGIGAGIGIDIGIGHEFVTNFVLIFNEYFQFVALVGVLVRNQYETSSG